MDDNSLIKLYVKGNESALAVLIARHKRPLYWHIYELVKDKELTEDFFQDTFIKVIQSLKSANYSEEGKFLPWVKCIARNLVMDHFRKSKQMRFVPEIVGEDGEKLDIFSRIDVKDENRTPQERKHIRREMRKLIRQLPYEQREVLILRTYYDFSFKEVAEMTNTTINTCLGRMRYALLNIKKLMKEQATEISV